MPPKAIRGVLDLTTWDLENEGTVDLTGEYEFYWKQLLPPRDFENREQSQKCDFIEVPGYWNGSESAGEKATGAGYATYRLKVLLHTKDRSLALKVLDMGTAFDLFVNGKNVYSAGTVGKTGETSKPQFHPRVIDFQSKANELEIILHVSNFHHRKGGAWEAIVLGTEDRIRALRETKVSYELFLFGSILITDIVTYSHLVAIFFDTD